MTVAVQPIVTDHVEPSADIPAGLPRTYQARAAHPRGTARHDCRRLCRQHHGRPLLHRRPGIGLVRQQSFQRGHLLLRRFHLRPHSPRRSPFRQGRPPADRRPHPRGHVAQHSLYPARDGHNDGNLLQPRPPRPARRAAAAHPPLFHPLPHRHAARGGVQRGRPVELRHQQHGHAHVDYPGSQLPQRGRQLCPHLRQLGHA